MPVVSMLDVSSSTYTLINLVPSNLILILLPTISLGNTKSSRIESWTAVNVRLKYKMKSSQYPILTQ